MLRSLHDYLPDTAFSVDVCIVGAGIAGLSVARQFIGTGVEVLVVDSGGRKFDPEVQALNRGESAGHAYYDLEEARLRFLGGTMNIWGGRCARMDAIDFESRPGVPYSGWPIDRASLAPYYERAEAHLGLVPDVYDETAWEHLGCPTPPLDSDRVRTAFWQFAPFDALYAQTRCEDLERAANVTLLTRATCTGIRTDADARSVRGLELATLDGQRSSVAAHAYVIACGGIENARLLLASNDVEPQGVGNAHDMVGRCFMEHPHGRAAHVQTSRPVELWRAFKRRHSPQGVEFGPTLRPGRALQREAGILNTSLTLKYQRWPGAGPSPTQSAYRAMKQRKEPDPTGLALHHATKRFNAALHRLTDRIRRPMQLRLGRGGLFLIARAEQAPNPDSRVTLSPERDELGMPRARLEWRLSQQDKRSVAVLSDAIGAELERLGWGTVEPYPWLHECEAQWPLDRTVSNNPIAGYHHMGTTRMASDPREGVVDENCRVHGYANLYVAGSSVFATSGWANPTLTLFALALRLAEHLSQCRRDP